MSLYVATPRAWWRCEKGAAAIEFAFIAMAVIMLGLGTLEFGRALHMHNQLSFAVDVGVREVLRDDDISDDALRAKVRAAFDAPYPDLLAITVGTETVDGVQFRTLALTYPVTLLVPAIANHAIVLNVARRAPIT
jgi:Flp pilus assembly protein TadG